MNTADKPTLPEHSFVNGRYSGTTPAEGTGAPAPVLDHDADSVLLTYARNHRDDVTAWRPDVEKRPWFVVVFNWTSHVRLVQGSAEQCCDYLGLDYAGKRSPISHTRDW